MALKDAPEKQSIAAEDMIKQWVSFFGGICSFFCIDQTINFFLLPLFFCC
jgi:hypothetical protein